jgi:hypothetical protein
LTLEPIAPVAVILAKGFSMVSYLAAAISQGLPMELSRSGSGGGAGVPCTDFMCEPQGGGNIETTITFTDCVRDTQAGGIEIDGTMTLSGAGNCDAIPEQGNATIDLTIAFKNASNMTVLTDTAQVSGTYALTSGSSCGIFLHSVDSLDATLDGSVTLAFMSGPMATLSLQQLEVALTVNQYEPLPCVPTDYTLLVGGHAGIGLDVGGQNGLSLDADFNQFTMNAHVASGAMMVGFDGAIDAICFGKDRIANLVTLDALVFPTAELCPTAGNLKVLGNGQFFYPSGGLEIDDDLDGDIEDTFQSCVSPMLFGCVG